MKKYSLYLVFALLFLLKHSITQAQTDASKLHEVQEIVKKEGELFIAIERFNKDANKPCLEENSIANIIQFTNDSAFVNFVNHTELFCEVYIMRTHTTYHFSLKDVNPATIRLVEKKYDVGDAQVKEGKTSWFEIQLFTRDQKSLLKKRDIESKQTEWVSSVSIIVQEKEAAKKAISLLKSVINESLQ